MKKMVTLLMLLIAPAVFAKQSVTISPISFQVNADNALYKFEQTVLYPEGLLNRFQPVGAKITNKRVSQNEIRFTATKTLLFVTKSVRIRGVLESTQNNSACLKNEIGYDLTLDLGASNRIVTKNVESLEAIICLNSQSDSKLTGTIRSKIIIGNKYSKVYGPIAIGLIKDQVPSLLNALTEEIKSMR